MRKKQKPKPLIDVLEQFPCPGIASEITTGIEKDQEPWKHQAVKGPEIKVPVPGPLPPPEDLDPWQHRAEHMRCVTCMWWLRKGGTKIGRCRRNAPTYNGFPVMFQHDWCGEHRIDETRI